MKIADGSSRAAGPALIHALEQVGGLEPSHVSALAERARPPVLGGGHPVGNLEPVFTLRRR